MTIFWHWNRDDALEDIDGRSTIRAPLWLFVAFIACGVAAKYLCYRAWLAGPGLSSESRIRVLRRDWSDMLLGLKHTKCRI